MRLVDEIRGVTGSLVRRNGNAASHRALCVLRQENPDWWCVEIRSRRYLNSIVEQDHRAIKRRCAPMLAMKSFHPFWVVDACVCPPTSTVGQLRTMTLPNCLP
jgi:transposase-like protein